MFVADFRPLAFTASMNSGKIIDGTICAGWRIVLSTERRASTPTWVPRVTGRGGRARPGSAAAVALMRAPARARPRAGRAGPAAPGALERAAGLREEDVVERRLVQPQVGDLQALGVERADDVGERLLGLAQAHRDALDRAAAILAEALEHAATAARSARVGGDRLERRAPDLGLQLGRRALGDDLAVVDDADAVGEDVGLLEVLRGEEHGHAVVGGEARDLLPQRRAALDVEAGRRLVEEQDPRVVDEREREVEPPLHAARVAADAAVGGVAEPDALEQLVAAPRSIGRAGGPGARPAGAGARGRSASGRARPPAAPRRSTRARARRRGRRRGRRRAPSPRSAAAASSASARSSTCRRRSVRGSRRSRPARRRGRCRRPRAVPCGTGARVERIRSRVQNSSPYKQCYTTTICPTGVTGRSERDDVQQTPAPGARGDLRHVLPAGERRCRARVSSASPTRCSRRSR